MTNTRSRIAIAVTAGAIAAAFAAVPARADTSTPPPAVGTQILATGPISPTLLLGHGQTKAGAPWGILMLTRGTTDGYVVDNKFPPGSSTGWHSHAGPSLIYVVSGTIGDYDDSNPNCAPVYYTKGQVFTDSGGTDVHMLRNDDGTVAAETIAVQFIPGGQPRKVNEPEPAGCNY
jgi:hypothetical protein